MFCIIGIENDMTTRCKSEILPLMPYVLPITSIVLPDKLNSSFYLLYITQDNHQ